VIGPAVVIAIWVLSSPGHARFGGGFAGGGFRGPVGGGFRGGSSGFHYGGDGFAGGNPEHTAWSSESHPQYGSHPYGSSYPTYHPNEQSASSYQQFNQEHPNSNMSYGQYNQANANYNQYKSEHPADTSTTSNTYNSKSYSYDSTNPNSGNQSYHPYGTTNAESAYSTNQAARYNEMNSMNQSRYNEAESMQHEHYQNESALSQQQYNQASNLQSNSNYDPYGGCCGSSGGSAAAGAAVGMVGGMAMGAAMESATQPRQPTTVIENVQAPAPMPIGTTVPALPPGATPTQVNGTQYFYANGNYFRPVFNGSQVVYVASPA